MTKGRSKGKPRQPIFELRDPNIVRASGDLAREIGFVESVVLLQIEFLVSISINVRDGRVWTYQSARNLREEYFPWWSESTIDRAIKSLAKMGLIIIDNYNRHRYDRTRWFTLNCEELAKLQSIAICHSDRFILQGEETIPQDEESIQQGGVTIPETTEETTTTTEDLHDADEIRTELDPVVVDLLRSFGIADPALRETAAGSTPSTIRGWIRYIRSEDGIDDPCAFLVSQLRGDPSKQPPGQFGELGEISENHWLWLRQHARLRRVEGRWRPSCPVERYLAERWITEYEKHHFGEEVIEPHSLRDIWDLNLFAQRQADFLLGLPQEEQDEWQEMVREATSDVERELQAQRDPVSCKEELAYLAWELAGARYNDREIGPLPDYLTRLRTEVIDMYEGCFGGVSRSR